MSTEKSPRNAILLAAVTVLSFTITDAILNILVPYLLSGDIRSVIADPESLSSPLGIASLVLFLLLMLLILIAIGAFWFYRFFGEAYYGPGSAARWGLFGFLFALLLKLPEWILPESWGIARALLQIVGLLAAFFIARKLIPLRRV